MTGLDGRDEPADPITVAAELGAAATWPASTAPPTSTN
ncbi:hypothetical protein [Streptomyces sp. SCUT-3]